MDQAIVHGGIEYTKWKLQKEVVGTRVAVVVSSVLYINIHSYVRYTGVTDPYVFEAGPGAEVSESAPRTQTSS